MLPLSTWKHTPFPSPWEINGGGGGPPAAVAGLGLFWEEERLPPRPTLLRAARPRPRAGLCGRQVQGVRPGPGSPGRRALVPAALGPPWKGLNFGPRSADTRGSVNAMTSPFVSAAQQEMLSASPLPAQRKWGSFSPEAAAAPSQTSFWGQGAGQPFGLPAPGRRGQGHRGGCTYFAVAHLAELARDRHCAERTGMSLALGRPQHLHNRTPGQVGQKHWQAPEIGANSAE